MPLKVFVLALSIGFVHGWGQAQHYAVRGKITCDGEPVDLVRVQMYDYDKISEDDLMAETNTSEGGYFALNGTSTEVTEIEPYLMVYHHCGDTGEFLFVHCPLNYIYNLPTDKTNGEEVDIGTINLRGNFRRDDEKRGCL
ncbi:unnamed protein product [Bursaphelenchus okinawaensis]|uniref:Uncharacterized protein n=1 Tax=Bursaphelenchus okinawaensis TaxID=465554 RepID=A0A811K5Y6_9BILA|nr:unnamed protein product [Bursaphelenchus okinawaensis]CAG9092151.1 unnamed protein product [Bursaphelenchus okinawaensis]